MPGTMVIVAAVIIQVVIERIMCNQVTFYILGLIYHPDDQAITVSAVMIILYITIN